MTTMGRHDLSFSRSSGRTMRTALLVFSQDLPNCGIELIGQVGLGEGPRHSACFQLFRPRPVRQHPLDQLDPLAAFL
jgi:hypothetical protein